MLNLTWSLYSLTWQCPLKDNKPLRSQMICKVELAVFVTTSANCFQVNHVQFCFFFKWVCGWVFFFFYLYQCDTLDEQSSCCLGHFGRIQSVCTKHQWRWLSSAFFGQPHPANQRWPAVCSTQRGKATVHNWHSRCWLTSALLLGARPGLRCTTGGFSPVSNGKARDNFPVSSCKGHSLVHRS